MVKPTKSKIVFQNIGSRVTVRLDFTEVASKTENAKKRFLYQFGNRLRRKAASMFMPRTPDRRNPKYFDKNGRPTTSPARIRKTKSRKYGRPHDYSGKVPRSMAFGVIGTNKVIVGPQSNNKKGNLIKGIPLKTDMPGRKKTALSVLTFGGSNLMADRDAPEDKKMLITVNEWRAKGSKAKRDKVVPRPYMQLALDKVLKQKSTLKAFRLK